MKFITIQKYICSPIFIGREFPGVFGNFLDINFVGDTPHVYFYVVQMIAMCNGILY